MRYITKQSRNKVESQYGRKNDPFGICERKSADGASVESEIAADKDLTSYTKFHLEDDEMLMELMMHLNSDCPDIMRKKEELLESVSKNFDKIKS